MSRYLNLVATLSRTGGNDLRAYLALAVAVAILPGAGLFFAVLAVLALLRRLLSALADQLGELLNSGRVLLAERLRLAAAVIDPRHQDEAQTAPEPLPAVEATAGGSAVPEPVVQAAPVPVLMPSAAQVTVEGPAQAEGERERLAAALGRTRQHPGRGAGAGGRREYLAGTAKEARHPGVG